MNSLKSMNSRRELLRCLGAAGAAFLAGFPSHAGVLDRIRPGDGGRKAVRDDGPREAGRWSKESPWYVKIEDHLECTLCPNRCVLKKGARGKCRARANVGGKLYSLVYGNPAAVHVDPIEKKPLYHFHPGSSAFSIGFAGCSFDCLNCQNWELSQSKPEELKTHSLSPDDTVKLAKQRQCHSIAYTYNEPSVVFEYMLDTSRRAHESGLKNVWVTNGYLNPEPLTELCDYLDAANVDLKVFSEKLYARLNDGKLQPVLDTLILLKSKNIWFEITNLVVPTYSDDLDMIARMCRWIFKNLGPDYPLHFSRFHPQYKLQHLPQTPPSVLLAARKTALSEGLRHVYIGNYRAPGGEGANTLCSRCGKVVIDRIGYSSGMSGMTGGKCSHCGEAVAGRWG